MKGLLALLLSATALSAQVVVCGAAAVYEPCEISIELSAADAEAHENPYVSVDLRAEFRSPKGGSTKVMPAFWDGAHRFRIRFAPDFEGRWDLRLISNVASIDKKIFSFQATPARTNGFIKPFNSRYFRYDAPETPHYWLGAADDALSTRPWDEFVQRVDARAGQSYNHLRGLVLGDDVAAAAVLANPEAPLVSHFRELDRRVAYLNSKGVVADLVMAGNDDELVRLLPGRNQRERYARYLVARYGAFNVTWLGLEEYETYAEGRALLREFMGYVQRFDPYQHPRSTHSRGTSSPLAGDGWMTYISQQGASVSLAAIDYEMHQLPVVNTAADGSSSATTEEARRRLWRVAMRGSYPGFSSSVAPEAAASASHLYSFFNQTRYVDLQPYYRISRGAALSLHYVDGWDETRGVEYVVYLEEPGPVDVLLPKKGYDVSWFNPVDGSWHDQKKKFKGDRFRGTPPSMDHDWILYIRREGKKESFNKRFYLEARRVVPKEVETSPSELPFAIQLPDQQELVAGATYEFNATLTKSTEAAKRMVWLWSGEVSSSGRAAQVIGTEQFGNFRVPANLTDRYPATFSLRLLGIDGAGRLFEGFRAFTLQQPADE